MVTTKIENSAAQLAAAANIKKKWNNIFINVKEAPYNAEGDGETDDSLALQRAFNADTISVFLPDGDYFIPAGTILTITKAKYIFGPGRLVGPEVANQGGPSCIIKIHGTLGTSVNIGSVIAKNTKTFVIPNSFQSNDLLMISNFPTDATDAYTNGVSDMLGNTTRVYANLSASNLRQTRRKELAVIAGANSGQIGLRSGTLNAYNSTASLKFEKVNAVENVIFDGVTFQNIYVDAKYCRDFAFYKCRAYSSLLVIQTSINVHCDFLDFDAQDTAGRLNIFESSRVVRITGTYRGTHTPSDNGVIATNQTSDLSIDVIVEGVDGTFGHGVHIDNNFTENWTGYTDVPSSNININAVGRGLNGSTVLVSSNPFDAYVENIVINVASDDSSLQLTGVNGVIINAAMLNNTINLYGSKNIEIQGHHGLVFMGNYTNPRDGAAVEPCTNIRFNETGDYAPLIKGFATAGTTTYVTQRGDYIRTGRQITAWGYISWSATTGSTELRLAGLPYRIKPAEGYFPPVTLGFTSGITLTGVQLTAYGVNSSAEMVVGELISGGAFRNLAMPSSGEIVYSITYETDQ